MKYYFRLGGGEIWRCMYNAHEKKKSSAFGRLYASFTRRRFRVESVSSMHMLVRFNHVRCDFFFFWWSGVSDGSGFWSDSLMWFWFLCRLGDLWYWLFDRRDGCFEVSTVLVPGRWYHCDRLIFFACRIACCCVVCFLIAPTLRFAGTSFSALIEEKDGKTILWSRSRCDEREGGGIRKGEGGRGGGGGGGGFSLGGGTRDPPVLAKKRKKVTRACNYTLCCETYR